MAVDIDKMRQKREQAAEKQGYKDGPGFWKPPVGRTEVYLCPPNEEMDSVPFVEVTLHYGLGPAGKNMGVCLGTDNEVLWSEPVQKLLKEKRKLKLDPKAGCPVCDKLEADDKDLPRHLRGTAGEAKLKRMKQKPAYVMNIIPFFAWAKAGKSPIPEEERIVRSLIAGFQVWDGICDVIHTEGDITNPDGATLLRIKRTGEGLDTEYAVSADTDTVKAPLRLAKAQRALIRRDCAPGGEADPHRIVSTLVKDRDALEKLVMGEEVDEKKRDDDADPSAPACFGYDCDPADAECRKCPFKADCAAKCETEVPPDPKGKKSEEPATRAKTEPKTEKAKAPEKEPEPDPTPDEDEPAGKVVTSVLDADGDPVEFRIATDSVAGDAVLAKKLKRLGFEEDGDEVVLRLDTDDDPADLQAQIVALGFTVETEISGDEPDPVEDEPEPPPPPKAPGVTRASAGRAAATTAPADKPAKAKAKEEPAPPATPAPADDEEMDEFEKELLARAKAKGGKK